MQSFYGAAGAAKFRCPLEEFESPSQFQAEQETIQGELASGSSVRAHVPQASIGYPSTRTLATGDDWSQPAPTLQDVAVVSAVEATALSSTARYPNDGSIEGGLNGKGPGSYDLRTMSFRDWLLWLEPSSSLLGYLEVIQENYDSVAQIVKTYMVPAKGGRRVLDTQFFDDINARSEKDQAAFLRWFMRESGASGVPHTPPPSAPEKPATANGEQRAGAVLGAIHSQHDQLLQEQQSSPTLGVGGDAASPGAPLDLRTCSFRSWLERVGSGGELLDYLDALEDSFDTVAQITRTYVVDSGAGGKELDGQLFEDIGVSSQQHQDLFRAWFEIACGVRRGGPGGSTAIASWLQTHGLEEYVGNLDAAGYDELSLLADLHGEELAEMLDAVGLSKPGHRAKFRRAVEALRGGSGAPAGPMIGRP